MSKRRLEEDRSPGIENLLDYAWSSHKAYLSTAKKWEWISKETILNMLSRNKSLQKAGENRQEIKNENQ